MAVRTPLIVLSSLLLLQACSQSQPQARGPIVMGDPATIVTETDSQYLHDALPDFEATTVPAAPITDPSPAKDTVVVKKEEPAAEKVPAVPAGQGLNVDFGNVSVFFPDLKVQNAGRSVKGASSAAYTSEAPAIGTKSLAVSGGEVKRVRQRLGYNAVARQGGTTLVLTALGTQNGPWQELSGGNGRYTVAAQPKLPFNPSAAAIRTAVQKAARIQRLSRKEEQSFLTATRNVRSVTQAPLAVALRNATWRIEGTDNKGKRYMKEIRVDIPL